MALQRRGALQAVRALRRRSCATVRTTQRGGPTWRCGSNATQWNKIAKQVRDWESEATDAALGLTFFGIGDEPADGSASAPKRGSKKKKKVEQDAGEEPDEETTMRKELTALVERSTRVYGVLYGAMPEHLRKQAESVARGHANGLWQWLETKLQSTEQDSVGALLEQWVALGQDEDESFD